VRGSIYDIIKGNAQVGADCMIESVQTTNRLIKCHRNFVKTSGVEELDRSVDKLFGSLDRQTETSYKVLKALKRAFREGDEEYVAGLRKVGAPMATMFMLLLKPSDKTYSTKVELHHAGVQIANASHVLLALAHLYQAVRHYGLVTTTWDDMDFIIAKHSAKQAYVMKLNAGADAKAIARHYQISLGVSASSLVRSGKQKLPSSASIYRIGRQISMTSAFMSAMYDKAYEE